MLRGDDQGVCWDGVVVQGQKCVSSFKTGAELLASSLVCVAKLLLHLYLASCS